MHDVEAWRTEFLKDEAREVVSVVGGWIYCFRRPLNVDELEALRDALKAISEVVERGSGYDSESIRLAVAMPQFTTPYLDKSYEEWDEICGQHGFEYVDFEAKGKNEFGGECSVRVRFQLLTWPYPRASRHPTVEGSSRGE